MNELAMSRGAARLSHAGPVAALIVLVVSFHVAVRCFGLDRTGRWASRFLRVRPAPEAEGALVEAARLRVRFVKRRLPAFLAGNCLSRSLALWWLLARRGIPTKLLIGTDRRDGEFRAHAWVEHRGVPLNAGRLVRGKYAAFDRDFAPRDHG